MALVSAFLLHFLRVRSRPVTVPTILFWREAVKERSPRVLFRRLSRLGSLILVLLVLLSLLFSAGEPGASGKDAPCRIYLLDPAVQVLPGAKEEALSILERTLPSERGRIRCALLLAGSPCRALSSPADPPLAALGALEELPPWKGDVPRRNWREGIRTALSLLRGRKKGSVLVLAVDPSGLPREKTLPGGIPLEVLLLPAPLWDDGVEAAMPVRLEDGKWSLLVRARRKGKGGPVRSLTVRNSSGKEEVKLLDDKAPRAEILLSGLPPGGRVEAFLSGKDPFPPNDRLVLAIPPGKTFGVYAPSAGRALRAALAALDGVEVAEDPSSAAVAVLRDSKDLDRVRGLPSLLFGLAAGADPGGARSQWRPASFHPLVRGLSFSGVSSSALPGPKGLVPLVRNSEGTVVGILPGSPTRILVAADPEAPGGRLSESPDFPRFFGRALRSLSGLVFPEDGVPRSGWGRVVSGLDGGSLPLKIPRFPEIRVPLREGAGEWPSAGGGPVKLGGEALPVPSGGGPALAGDLERPAGEAGGPGRGGLPPAFLLGLLGLFFLTLEWWAFNRGRAA